MLSRSWPRVALWLLHMAIPMAALWLLVRRPAADARWEHHHAHFGLVLAMAAVVEYRREGSPAGLVAL